MTDKLSPNKLFKPKKLPSRHDGTTHFPIKRRQSLNKTGLLTPIIKKTKESPFSNPNRYYNCLSEERSSSDRTMADRTYDDTNNFGKNDCILEYGQSQFPQIKRSSNAYANSFKISRVSKEKRINRKRILENMLSDTEIDTFRQRILEKLHN